jgi:3-hydroxyisobutyrate dehydrogenase-like beta-hydroxyacid dehydrogenase
MPSGRRAASRFRDRSATVAIIGLGYVGLPLVQALLDNGLAVIGIEVDAAKSRRSARAAPISITCLPRAFASRSRGAVFCRAPTSPNSPAPMQC